MRNQTARPSGASILSGWHAAGAAGLFVALGGSPALADDYCCPCDNTEAVSISERNSIMANLKCSLVCRGPTKAQSGQCAAPAPQAAAPAAVEKGEVLLFGAEDCSGDVVRVTGSTGELSSVASAEMRSFQVASGHSATAYPDARFVGTPSGPVAPSVCVSPGWPIKSIRIGTR